MTSTLMRDHLEAVLNGEGSIADVYAQLPAWNVSVEAMINDILMHGWIWIGAKMGEDGGACAVDKPRARRSLKALNGLFDIQSAKEEVINYFWQCAFDEPMWLEAVVPHLSSELLYNLILAHPFTGVGDDGANEVSVVVIRTASKAQRNEVCEHAASLGMIMSLSQKAGWPECLVHADSPNRDRMFSSDLGL